MGVTRKAYERIKNRSCRLEHKEQAELVKWARNCGFMLYRNHNGGERSGREAAQAIAQGELPGVPDLFLPIGRAGYHGLYVEMKREKEGALTPSQKLVIPKLEEQGYRVAVCHGVTEGKNAILEYCKL